MGLADRSPFSNVRAEDLDISDDEAPVLPSNGMEGMMGPDMSELAPPADMDDFDIEENFSCHMGEKMVGEERDISKGTGECLKKLLRAGQGYDNPDGSHEVVLTYTATVLGADAPFDSAHAQAPLAFLLHPEGEGCPVPVGVCKALRTFLRGERSLLTLQPAVAFGEAGDAARGVPAGAVVQYEVELLAYHKVQRLLGGQVLLKCVEDAKTWEGLEPNSEVFVAYELRLPDGRVVQAADGALSGPRYVMGADEANARSGFPPVLAEILKHARPKSKYEATVAPAAAYGGAGEPSLGVPADSPLTVSLQVQAVYPVVELEAAGAGGGGLRKKTLDKGEGWASPQPGWEVRCHYALTAADGALLRTSRAAEPVAFVLGAEAAAGLPRTFEHVRGMKRREVSQFRAGGGWLGEWGAGGGVCDLEVELLGWAEVRTVPGTAEQVRAKLLEAGDGSYERPNDGATVRVHLTVRLAPSDGAEGGGTAALEDSVGGEPLEVVVDDDVLPPAVELALKDMARGARAELSVPAQWGYTPALAAARGVPASAVGRELVATVELLSYERAKDEWELNSEERLVLQAKKKAQGNALFAQGRFELALPKYGKALSVVQDHEDEFDEEKARPTVQRLRAQCHLNMATCELKLAEPQRALEQANRALSIDARSAKGFLRRGQARMALGDLAEARADLLQVLKLDPTNRDARDELAALREKAQAHRLKEKALYADMFAKVSFSKPEESIHPAAGGAAAANDEDDYSSSEEDFQDAATE